MRFMMFMYPEIEEKDWNPSAEAVEAMSRYNEELRKAGMLLSLDGLQPPSEGGVVSFDGEGRATVTDGPFAEAKEVVGGYWLIQARSKEEALEWAASFGDRVRGIIALATTARSSAMTLALNAVGRQAIINDPNWRGGDYYGGPVPASGLATARQIGHISYLSAEALADKFDRRWQEPGGPHWSHAPEFAVESYLAHQGQRFVQRFDANSYLVITRAMDYFDLEQRPGGLAAAFAQTAARFFVASWNTDWLYPPVESVQIAQAAQAAGREVTYYPFESTRGHDAFLLEDEQMTPPLADWLAATFEG